MNGLHLIGDVGGCRCDPKRLLDGREFEQRCLEFVKASGLTTMSSSFHQFEGGGYTGTVAAYEVVVVEAPLASDAMADTALTVQVDAMDVGALVTALRDGSVDVARMPGSPL